MNDINEEKETNKFNVYVGENEIKKIMDDYLSGESTKPKPKPKIKEETSNEDNEWQKVQKYQEPEKNVTSKKSWKKFVIALCIAGLGGSIKLHDNKKMTEEKLEEIEEIVDNGELEMQESDIIVNNGELEVQESDIIIDNEEPEVQELEEILDNGEPEVQESEKLVEMEPVIEILDDDQFVNNEEPGFEIIIEENYEYNTDDNDEPIIYYFDDDERE